jgi:DENN domain-containing protein 11
MLTIDMDISGVEFKSMPSGLHNINEDLVYFTTLTRLKDRYFVMPPYAGLSAYYRKEAPSSQRNARMVSIGILVPSTGRYGRLGRAWNYAEKLKDLAKFVN